MNRYSTLLLLVLATALFCGCGNPSQSQKDFDKRLQEATEAYEKNDSNCLVLAENLLEKTSPKDSDNYIMARYTYLISEIKHGDKSKVRLLLFEWNNDLNRQPSVKSEAYYYLAKGEYNFHRTSYIIASGDYQRSAELMKQLKNDKESALINLYKARSDYGLFKCEDAIAELKKAEQHDLGAYWNSILYQFFCLSYGYLEDAAGFEKYYALAQENNIGIRNSDKAIMDAYHEAFQTGTIRFEDYQERMSLSKFTKMKYLVSRLLKNDREALKNNEAFVAISKNAQNKVIEKDLEYAAMDMMVDKVRYQLNTYLAIGALILTLMVILGSLIIILIIRRKNKAILEINQMKTDFVQTMAHDVRTPLNAVVGFSQLLSLPADYLTEEERTKYADFVAMNSQLLTILIDDVLTVGNTGSQKMSINMDTCQANVLGRQAVMTCEHRCKPGVVISYNPNEVEESLSFQSDPNRVLEVLINFLTNACKNTDQGSITLAASLTDNPGYLTYTVTDTGCGIPPEKRDKVFQRFVKLDEKKQGSGLGLNICMQIAEKLNARIGLDPTYNEGARFYFQIPV